MVALAEADPRVRNAAYFAGTFHVDPVIYLDDTDATHAAIRIAAAHHWHHLRSEASKKT